MQHFELPFALTDVAGVDADLCHPSFDGLERILVVEMDVCHHGHLGASDYFWQGVSIFRARNGNAYDVRSGVGQAVDFSNRLLDIMRLGGRNRLDGDRCSAADGYLTYVDLSGLSSGAFHANRVRNEG